MQLVDMKLPKKTKKELAKQYDSPEIGYGEQDRWPYGLQIRFETEQIKDLPILANKVVGDKCIVYAEATVMAVRQSERQTGRKEHTVELQIEKVNIKPKVTKAVKDMNPGEYKEFRTYK